MGGGRGGGGSQRLLSLNPTTVMVVLLLGLWLLLGCDNLQKAFLPWPISLIHFVPDWVILSVIGVVALLLFRVLFDPIMAICTLIRDSSLSLTQKISSVIVPATAISWMNRKRNQGIDSSNIEDFEMRVSDLENKMSWFSKVFISDKDSNTPMRLQIETRA